MKLDSNITAIVTGGASGLGEATARMLAEKGVKIGIFDLNEERGEAVASELGGPLPRSMSPMKKRQMQVLRKFARPWAKSAF